ncbi:hypothetical protein NKDENANG_02623 [Candidatus Entotheonellaceae bacterium PAL068K]
MRKQSETVLFITGGGCLILIYHGIFGQYFPNLNGRLGHDYSAFLPRLLDGYFWYRTNGPFAAHWFTPAFCGGVPLLPAPYDLYYSVPQFLSFVMDPLSASYLTFLLFAAIGFIAFYLLLRQAFFTTPPAAFFGAGLFLFNGFYAHRLLIGHLTYHAFMLVPFISLFLLRPLPETRKAQAWRLIFDCVMSGVLLAYTFQSGMINVIIPSIISMIIIALIHGILHRQLATFWLRLTLAGILSLCLCAARLVATVAYLDSFPRESYPLPGVRSVVDAAVLLFQSLFLGPAHETAQEVLVNMQWLLDRHEFEFGVTFIPLLVLLLGGAAALHRCSISGAWRRSRRDQWLLIGAMGVLLCLPILLNYYTPTWNALLKQIPIIKNNTTLTRWFCLYIPIVILLASLVVEKTALFKKYESSLVLLSMAVVITLNVVAERDFYHTQRYDPRVIVNAYHHSQSKDWSPRISHIDVFVDRAGRAVQPLGRNDVLAQGSSQLLCYEGMFGYRLENFPVKTLHPGSTLEVNNGRFNLKNPACYVYPTENDCAPGDHFTIDQRQATEAFITYRPFAFQVSIWQKAANLLNLISVGMVTAFLVFYGCIRADWLARKWRSAR